MKACTMCRTFRPFEDFFRDKSRDGLKPHCRDCHNAAARMRYHRNPHILQRSKELRRQRGRKGARLREEKTVRGRARRMVRNAVGSGRLAKPLHCEHCGRETPRAELHGHHEDYSRPLDVRWLCRVCHHLLDPNYGKFGRTHTGFSTP